MENLCQLSVVVPVYNEGEGLSLFFYRLMTALKRFEGNCQIVFVDDGSVDQSRGTLRAFTQNHQNVSVIFLSRNFGHQAAISAGLAYAKGEAVVVIDGDLQDPPELIPDLYDKFVEGNEVVYAVRRTRKGDLLKRFFYWFYYRCLGLLAQHPIPFDVGDFCIMSGRVVHLLNSMPEKDRFLRGIRAWVGFRQSWLGYDRDERSVGKSKYTFRALVKLGLDGVFSSSDKPLRLSSLLGFGVSVGAILFAAVAVLWHFGWGKRTIPGYASLAAGVFFLGGVQLVSIGILGEYIGRIFNQIKGRPLYVVEEEVNVEK